MELFHQQKCGRNETWVVARNGPPMIYSTNKSTELYTKKIYKVTLLKSEALPKLKSTLLEFFDYGNQLEFC